MKKQKYIPRADGKDKVIMKFSEDKFYNDLKKPMFEAGKEYEMEGAGWIERWLKRGGEIVKGEVKAPAPVPQAPSKVVVPGKKPVSDKAVKTGDAGKKVELGKAQKPQASK